MSFKYSIIVFGILLSGGLSSYFLVHNGLYPVAIVNFDFITAERVEEDALAAYKYFQNALLVYGSDPHQLDNLESRQEIKRATLDKLISDSLIYRELNRRLKDEFQSIAERQVEQFFQNNNNIEEGVKVLYGLDLAEFKDRVLLPQAYKEILEGRMFLNNEAFDNWLNSERGRAKVFILAPGLEWDGESLKLLN